MYRIKAFGIFWYDFIFGDDWKIAVGVISGLGLSAVVVHIFRTSVWWLMPLTVMSTLAISLRLSLKR